MAELNETRPQLVHLSGKTCTGKSTLADRLATEFGYSVVRLDDTVNDAVIEQLDLSDRGSVFVEVYRRRSQPDWIERFVRAAQAQITSALSRGGSVVVDGAIANIETLRELFEPFDGWLMVCLHPKNIEQYCLNLLSRFVLTDANFHAGLPSRFWNMVDEDDFSQFCITREVSQRIVSAIKSYAASSQSESTLRIAAFQEAFANVTVVNT